MIRARRALAAAAAIAAATGAGCHRAPPGPAAAEAAEGGADPAEAGASPLAVGPSRCRATDWNARFSSDAAASELELGDAVPFAEGVAVGMLRRAAGDRGELVASVAFFRPDADSPPRIVDLGPALGDDPPPRLALRAGEVLASFHGLPRARLAGDRTEPARQLLLRAVTPDGMAALFGVDEGRDDSLASDLAVAGERGLLVWDEATSEPRGVIVGAPFSGRQRAGGGVELSPKESDAEMPRAVAYAKGFAVAWIARGPDPQSVPPDGSEPEVPGETRTRGWLEMALVDEHGVSTTPVRRLTPPTGHVTAFDLTVAPARAAAADSGGAPTLLLVARDEGEAVDGSGGALLRVRVTPDSVEPPVAVATDGLGRGAPTFVDGIDGPASWLSWVGPNEQLRMLAVDAAGGAGGLPSAEDAMNDARPVLALPSGRVLVETPGDAARPLRTFSCSR